MDVPTRLERLNEGEIPVGIEDPAVWAARLLEWRRDHGLDPTLDAGVWLAWADWSLSRLRYRAAYADAQAALDKLEAVIQHNESPISMWEPLEYDLNRTYANENVAFSPYLTRLRREILRETEEKIARGE